MVEVERRYLRRRNLGAMHVARSTNRVRTEWDLSKARGRRCVVLLAKADSNKCHRRRRSESASNLQWYSKTRKSPMACYRGVAVLLAMSIGEHECTTKKTGNTEFATIGTLLDEDIGLTAS